MTTTATAPAIDIVTELKSAFADYQIFEKRGLAFGQRLYELRAKSSAQGNHSGTGFLPLLQQAGIPQRTAYYWIHSYEISIGEREPKEDKEKRADVVQAECVTTRDEMPYRTEPSAPTSDEEPAETNSLQAPPKWKSSIEPTPVTPQPEEPKERPLSAWASDATAAEYAKRVPEFRIESETDGFWSTFLSDLQRYAPISSGAAQQIAGNRGLHVGFRKLVNAHSTPANHLSPYIAEALEKTAAEFLSLAKVLRAKPKPTPERVIAARKTIAAVEPESPRVPNAKAKMKKVNPEVLKDVSAGDTLTVAHWKPENVTPSVRRVKVYMTKQDKNYREVIFAKDDTQRFRFEFGRCVGWSITAVEQKTKITKTKTKVRAKQGRKCVTDGCENPPSKKFKGTPFCQECLERRFAKSEKRRERKLHPPIHNGLCGVEAYGPRRGDVTCKRCLAIAKRQEREPDWVPAWIRKLPAVEPDVLSE